MSDLLLTLLLSLFEATLYTKLTTPPPSPLLTITTLFTLQYLLLKTHRHLLHPLFLSPLRHLPGPTRNIPFLGQSTRIFTSPTPLEPFLSWSETWPRAPFIRYLGLGNRETLLINTVDAHREVLQTQCYAFKKPDLLFRLVGDVLGRGLVFAEGAEHKRQRRILMGLFSVGNLRGMAPVFREKGGLMAGWFDEEVGEGGRGVFDLLLCYTRMGLDVAGRTVLGVELDHLKSADRKWDFAGCYHRIFQPSTLTGLITFINAVVPIRSFLPIEANLGYMRDVSQTRAMVTECVRQRIREVDEPGLDKKPHGSGSSSDLLTLILKERQMFKGSEDELTEEEIVNQLLTFVVTGHETTVGTLVWASYTLARKPDVQDKLRTEILDAITNKDGGSLAWEDIDRLPYLNNFVREVLRLYAPPVITYREAIKDVTICNIFIPRGTLLHFSVHLAGRSKDTWGDDAEEFIPERWDNRQGEAASPYAFGAFSHGPRVCIGRGFALMNVKMYLVEMVRRFRFFESPDMKAWGDAGPPLLNPSLSLMAKGGLKVGIERI